MKQKSIEEINEKYDLELDKVVSTIKKQKARKVLLQFPEGLKPYSLEVSNYVSEKSSAEVFIWIDSCFGACDLPIEAENLGVYLVVQFGHSKWSFKNKDIKVL